MTNDKDFRSIKDINRYLELILTADNNTFWLSGLVTKKFTSTIGHTYFTLKDQQYSISCMLPNKYSEKAVYISKGTMVDVYGDISFYKKEAKVQIKVSNIQIVQLDDSGIDYTVLKYLESNGLLPKPKKDLPKFPEHISVITSKYSEALSDFRHIYREQKGKARLEVMESYVQGDKAPEMIANRIKEANKAQKADIILLTRGGGRAEDLSVFNSVEVAIAICQSKIPIVTGIGHQRDETMADHIADQKTISPTDAAYKLANLSSETIANNKNQTKQQLNQSNKKQSKYKIFFIILFIIFVIILIITIAPSLLQ